MSPPEATKPRCYWYWMDGRVTKEGITRDLEAMKKVGMGAAYIGIIAGQAGEVNSPTITPLSEEWWQLLEHAVREGGRLGVDIGLFNGPGWSQSGGPWVKPTQAMRHVVTSELRVRGPQRFRGALPAAKGAVQDIATLAFPAPSGDSDTIGKRSPKITSEPALEGAPKLFDGDASTSVGLPGKAQLTLEVAEPFTARSLTVSPSGALRMECELLASDDGRAFRSVRRFGIDRHNLAPNVGPVPLAPVAVSFPEVRARFFRLEFSGGGALGEAELSGAARVESFQEKQLAKVFQDPLPAFDTYVWPRQPEPESPGFSVARGAVRDISASLSGGIEGGALDWEVPEGEWVVQRVGLAPTGVTNSPAPAEGTGFEIDKMSREAVRAHFGAYVGKLLARMPAPDRRALKYLVADSYETGSQNWTDGLASDFKARYGYDPTPFLPVMTGRVVGSAEESNRFLWDLRRIIADRVSSDYAGALSEVSRQNGLKMWLENYGHWGFPGEFLQYGGAADEIGGEFWATGSLGSIELRDAASAAHTYGKPSVFAEAWTGGPLFSSTPWSLKTRGDWAFSEGINHFVLHLAIAQPDERRPGVSAPFGTEFNRHNTWFPHARSWFDYLRRNHWMLQQGRHVADVAYFIGEDAPKMAGARDPELPAGYSFDYINADVIEKRLQVKDGRFVLPDGTSYKLIVLPAKASLRPALMRRLRDLVAAGGAVFGAPPTHSPSLEDYPRSDAEIQAIASQMWKFPAASAQNGPASTWAAFGRGRVFRAGGTEALQEALLSLQAPPDVAGLSGGQTLHLHRSTPGGEVYFLSNQTDATQNIAPLFRVTGRAPELWDAGSGEVKPLAVYQAQASHTRVPLSLPPRGSAFVVFRGASSPERVLRVLRDGKEILSATPSNAANGASSANAAANAVASSPADSPSGNFTMSLWAKPADEAVLLPEASSGIIGIQDRRNDAVVPTHGEAFEAGAAPGERHAGAGISVGTNGVSVFEHSGSYFVPILSHAAPLSGWTHLAVVYEGNKPTLYINGARAHTGLQSRFRVHPGAPSGLFRGSVGELQVLARALSAEEVAALSKSTQPRATVNAPAEVTRGANGRAQLLAWQPGRYTLQSASGKAKSVVVGAISEPVEIGGPWQVGFEARSGAPSKVEFEKLVSWTQRSEPAIKYHSGTAKYVKSFQVPASSLGAGKRLFLDLGDVQSLAKVTLNGRDLGTLWKAPFVLDVSQSARAGLNTLEVDVTNVWHNRLVGQKLAPEAFAAPGVEQTWASVLPNYGPGEPLFASGLIGPVTLRQAAVVAVP